MKEFQTYARVESGKPMRRLALTIPADLHARMKARCAVRGELVATVLRQLLAREFGDAQASPFPVPHQEERKV